ncbi:tetratricopeptide repeat protein [Thermosulfurimonas marina]|uniref:Tetratricopeptide repeat protein n=1 Tax=Thermosulfurimonas marina TaxID=2047767 RepID=A0A6H1WUN0_9BACT|nr:tetratricopeptide repeat protein [Thermosulfurimonas marina]QJA06907.1 tetratricopeptide repeat protein [Thermosulfurimonas marina]
MPQSEAGEEILVLHEKWVRVARGHLREIVATVVGLVLVLSLWAGYRYYRDRREVQAVRLYVKALSQKDRDSQIKLLENLVHNYGDTVAGREARLNLWESRLSSSSPEELLKELKALEKGARAEVKSSLRLGEGYLLEEKEDFKAAAGLYEEVLKEAPFSEGVVSADLARVYERIGDFRRALEYYRRFVAQKPPLEALSFVEYKLSILEKRLGQSS